MITSFKIFESENSYFQLLVGDSVVINNEKLGIINATGIIVRHNSEDSSWYQIVLDNDLNNQQKNYFSSLHASIKHEKTYWFLWNNGYDIKNLVNSDWSKLISQIDIDEDISKERIKKREEMRLRYLEIDPYGEEDWLKEGISWWSGGTLHDEVEVDYECAEEDHDWEFINTALIDDKFDIICNNFYKCSTCGKIKHGEKYTPYSSGLRYYGDWNNDNWWNNDPNWR